MLMFQGSEKLLQLVSDYSQAQNSIVSNGKGNDSEHNKSKHVMKDSPTQWVSACIYANLKIMDLT